MRVLVVGDSHGDSDFIEFMFHQAIKRNCSKIFQLGDFGFWPHVNWGRKFIEYTREASTKYEIPLYWIDGNHDAHPSFWLHGELGGDNQFYRNNVNFLNTGGNTWYSPRGHTWEWDGIKFLSVGGAWSIDKDQRVPGQSWWETELISYEDVEFAKKAGKVNVLFSHDTVTYVKVPGIHPIKEGERNREKIDEIVKHCQPELLIHGHYHTRYSSAGDNIIGTNDNGLIWHRTQVEGLDCNKSSPTEWESFVVLDTSKFDSYEKRVAMQ